MGDGDWCSWFVFLIGGHGGVTCSHGFKGLEKRDISAAHNNVDNATCLLLKKKDSDTGIVLAGPELHRRSLARAT